MLKQLGLSDRKIRFSSVGAVGAVIYLLIVIYDDVTCI